jgi:hypothetical protein
VDISLKEDKKAVKIQIWIENKYGGKYNNRLNAQTQKCYIIYKSLRIFNLISISNLILILYL